MPGIAGRSPLSLGAVGLVAGACSGFLGIGGGLIVVPALTLLAGYPIKSAVGASLATMAVVALVGSVVEIAMKDGTIYWSLAAAVTAGSIVGVQIAGRILPRLPERTLRVAFAAFLLIASGRMVWAAGTGLGWITVADEPYVAEALTLPVGLMAGLTSTLFGLGGGIVTVPCLTMLFGDVSFHAARATSLVAIVPTALSGAYKHCRLGTLDFGVVKPMLPMAVVGAILGVVAVNHVPTGPCRLVFGILLVAVAFRLLAQRPPSGAGARTTGARPVGEPLRRPVAA